MDKNPISIWKKPWRGPGGLLLSFIALFVVTFFLFYALGFISAKRNSALDLVKFATPCAFGCALVGALLIAFIHWLFCWRNFKRFLFGFACFATLVALFYAGEDWRGKHDWEKFKHEWEAKGEKFDWQSIVPPPVPDDQNFAFSPVWIAEIRDGFVGEEKTKAWYGDRIYSQEVSNLVSLMPVSVSTIVGTNMWNFPQPPENSVTWTSSRFSDLKPLQSYYRDLGKTKPVTGIIIAPQPQTPALDVLLALGKFDPVIEKLQQDSAKPYSRFPVQYDGGLPAAILLPHLAAEKRCAEVLSLRAVAELQNDENEKAFADVNLMFRLTDMSHAEPFLICHLVRIAILNLTLQPIWEGLAEHKWSDTQLVELEAELAKLDFLASCQATVRGERALEIANLEFVRHHPHDLQSKPSRLGLLVPMLAVVQALANMSSDNGDQMHVLQTLALVLGPSGWLDQNELRIARFDTTWYLPIVDEDTKTISPAKIRAAGDVLVQEFRHQTPENVLEALFIPAWGKAAEKFAFAQTSAGLARTAIALERYRLAHGEYPEALDALTPQFMAEVPHDIINGQPLKYRRDANGQFVLYSVGWNETDDGGVVVFKKGSSPELDTDQDEGDWVWRYPKNE